MAQTASPQSTVLVIIVAYESGEHLQWCVEALEAQTFRDWNAIVWNNASSDGATKRLSAGSKIRVVDHPENLGFAAANNRAAALASSRFIVTLNPDAFPEVDWLERLVESAEFYGAEAVASLQLNDANPEILDGAGDCMSISGIAWRGGYGQPRALAPTEPVEVFSPCAAAALYRRDAFDALGGFEGRFFCYFEDIDLGFRIRLAGGRCILEPRAIVRHVGSASSSKSTGFAEYYGARNRLWTFLRDMPVLLMPIALPTHLLAIAYLTLRVRDPETRQARIKGLRDGWAGRKVWSKQSRWTAPFALLHAISWSPLAWRSQKIVYSKLK